MQDWQDEAKWRDDEDKVIRDIWEEESSQWWVENREAAQPGASPSPRASREAAALPDNMAPSSSQRWLVGGGVDALEVSCKGFHREHFGANCEIMEKCRQAALAGKGGDRQLVVEGATLIVREKGLRWGMTFMPWVVDFDGITIAFARAGGSRKGLQAKVQISSLKLMRDGHEVAWEQSLRIMQEVGLVVDGTCVARIDLATDMPGVDIDSFAAAIAEGRCVTKLRGGSAFWRGDDGKYKGCSVGAGKTVMVRIYDKLRELKDRDYLRAAKLEALRQRRWGYVPEKAVRLEVQIRGAWLRAKFEDCKTVEGVFRQLAGIQRYVLENYLRLTETVPDRENKNQDRALAADFWIGAVDAAAKWAGESVELRRFEKKPVDKSGAEQRLVSALLSLAALNPERAETRDDLYLLAIETLQRRMPQDDCDWLDKVEQKFNRTIGNGEAGVFDFRRPREEIFDCGWKVVRTWDGPDGLRL